MTVKGMEGMEKFFMCYMLFMVSFWKAEVFGRKKAQKAQNKNGLNNKVTKQQRGKGRGVFYANYAN